MVLLEKLFYLRRPPIWMWCTNSFLFNLPILYCYYFLSCGSSHNLNSFFRGRFLLNMGVFLIWLILSRLTLSFMALATYSVTILSLLNKSSLFNELFNCILHMGALFGVVVVTIMEIEIFKLIYFGQFFYRVRIPNLGFLKLCVGTLFSYFPLECLEQCGRRT